jgi:hypothetical protein
MTPAGGLIMKSAKWLASVLAALFVALFAAFGCAPELERKATDGTAKAKGWKLQHDDYRTYLTTQKNPDGSNVKVSTREITDGSLEMRKRENEKYRSIAAKAGKEENESLEKLCSHPWWDERTKKALETDDPWRIEKMVEQMQEKGPATYFICKNFNYRNAADVRKMYADYSQRPNAKAISLQEYIGRYFGAGPFEFEVKAKPDETRVTRAEVIGMLLDALDNQTK